MRVRFENRNDLHQFDSLARGVLKCGFILPVTNIVWILKMDFILFVEISNQMLILEDLQ